MNILTKSQRVSLSFAAISIGWAVAYIVFAITNIEFRGLSYQHDFEFNLFWPLLFCLQGWAVVCIPFILKFDENSNVYAGFKSLFIGAACGLGTFIALGFLWGDLTPSIMEAIGRYKDGQDLNTLAYTLQLLLFSIVVGISFICSYSKLIKSHYIRTKVLPQRGANFGIVLFWPVMFLLFSYVIWPLGEILSPHIALRYGTMESQARATYFYLKRFEAGDSVAPILKTLDVDVDDPMGQGSLGGGCSYGEMDIHYEVKYEHGTITSIETWVEKE